MDVYKEWLGIPEGDRPPDHYTLLRLQQFEDDEEKIKKNYRKLNAHVRKYATGQYATESQELLNELAKAMICLTAPQDKRRYDESLGRKFDETEDLLTERSVTEVLVRQGIITSDQAGEVEDHAEPRGLSLQDAVVQLKYATRAQASEALAESLGLSFIDLEQIFPDEDVLDTVPRDVCVRNRCLPLFLDDGRVVVACLDQPEAELEDEIRLRFDGAVMRPVIAVPSQIKSELQVHYAPGVRNASESASAGKSGKKSSGKSGASGKAKPKKKRMNELSEEEQKERKNYGLIIMMASVVIGAMLDLVIPLRMKPFALFDNYCFTFLLAPIVVPWVLTSYWK